MRANGLAARVEKLEQRRGTGLIMWALDEGETKEDRRRRAIAELVLVDSPHLVFIMCGQWDQTT